MSQHPRPGRGFLGVEDAEFGFFGASGADFRARCATAAATATRVSRAGAWLVAAFFVYGVGLAGARTHQREVRRQDEPLPNTRALWARRRVITLSDDEQSAKVSAFGTREVVNGHGSDELENFCKVESRSDTPGGSMRIWHNVKVENFRR